MGAIESVLGIGRALASYSTLAIELEEMWCCLSLDPSTLLL